MNDIVRFETGPRMSKAVFGGGLIWLAGQVGTPGNDVATQTSEALAEVDRILAGCGTSRDRILKVTIWLADMADFAAMNEVYDDWVDHANPPTRATCEAKLASPDYRVEIIVVAATAKH